MLFFLVLTLLTGMASAALAASRPWNCSRQGHKWGSWSTTKKATCTENGSESRTCSECGKKETRSISAKGHSFKYLRTEQEATCTEDGIALFTCPQCSAKENRKIKATGHEWDQGKVTKEPGSLTPGEMTYTCEKCGETYTEEIPATEEPEEDPEGPKGPSGEVSPASLEESELYSVKVEVQNPDGVKYIVEPVEIGITFTNNGKKPVDVSCEGVGSDVNTWPESALVSCSFGEISKSVVNSKWNARMEPGDTATVTVRVSLKKEDADRGWIERKLPARFSPADASKTNWYPGDWPWEKKPRELDASFQIALGDPALKLDVYGPGCERIGETAEIGMTAYNYGPHVLYNWEVDVYEWDKDAKDYVFSETISPGEEQIRSPRPIAPSYYWFWGLSKKREVTEQTVADSDGGMLRFAFQARSWTKDGTPVLSDMVEREVYVYFAGVYLEAEDTSAGQTPEDGWVKAELTATNIGSEIMSFRQVFCRIDGEWPDRELHDYDLDWMIPGASEEATLWIKVYDEDIKAGQVRRLVYLDFNRRFGDGGKSLPPDTPRGHYVGTTHKFYTNEVEIIVPLPEPEAEPSVAPELPQPTDWCVPALTDAGGKTERTWTRCPEHNAVAKAADKLTEAERDEAREEAFWLWTDALDAEYGAMLTGADEAEKELISAEKAAFEAWLAAYRAALEAETADDAQAAEKAAEAIRQKTEEICYERHTAPKKRADLRAGAAEDWEQVRQGRLEELDARTETRILAADEAAREPIAAERRAYGAWLETREALLNRLYPGNPATVQEILARTVLERLQCD